MAIGRTNAGAGGSGGVNFKVVGGTTEPASPKENTIWVNTSVTIPSWVFSATEPGSPVEGMVWITTGTASNVAFNALKKNDVQVYPQSAKQYVGGTWVEKEIMIYQNGEWVAPNIKLYIVKNGVPAYAFSKSSNNKLTQGDGYYQVAGSQSGHHAAWVPLMDITNYNMLRINGTFTSSSEFQLCVWDNSVTSPTYQNYAAKVNLATAGAALDISGLTGLYSVGITNVYTNANKITDMWLTIGVE